MIYEEFRARKTRNNGLEVGKTIRVISAAIILIDDIRCLLVY